MMHRHWALVALVLAALCLFAPLGQVHARGQPSTATSLSPEDTQVGIEEADSCDYEREPMVVQEMDGTTLKSFVVNNPFGEVIVKRVAGSGIRPVIHWFLPDASYDVLGMVKSEHDLKAQTASLSLSGQPYSHKTPSKNLPAKTDGVEVTLTLSEDALEILHNSEFNRDFIDELASALDVPASRFHIINEVGEVGGTRVTFTISEPGAAEIEAGGTASQSAEAILSHLRTELDNPLSPARQDGKFLDSYVEEKGVETSSIEMYLCPDGEYRSNCHLQSASTNPAARSGVPSYLFNIFFGLLAFVVSGKVVGGNGVTSRWTVIATLVLLVTLTHAVQCPTANVEVEIGSEVCYSRVRNGATTTFTIVPCQAPTVRGGRCVVEGYTQPQCASLREAIPIDKMGVYFNYSLSSTSAAVKSVEYQILSEVCANNATATGCAEAATKWTAAVGNKACGAECWQEGTLNSTLHYHFRLRLTDANEKSVEIPCVARNPITKAITKLFKNHPHKDFANKAPVAGYIWNGHAESNADRNYTSVSDKALFKFQPFNDPMCHANLQHQVAVGTTECGTDVAEWETHAVSNNPQLAVVHGLSLTDGEYFVSVRAANLYQTTTKCHKGFTVDTGSPVIDPSINFMCDRSEPEAPVVEMSWKSTAYSGINHIEWALADSNQAFLTNFTTHSFGHGRLLNGEDKFTIPASELEQFSGRGNGNVFFVLRAVSNANVYSAPVSAPEPVYMGKFDAGLYTVSNVANYVNDGTVVDTNVKSSPFEISWAAADKEGFKFVDHFLVGLGTSAGADDTVTYLQLDASKRSHVFEAEFEQGKNYYATVVAKSSACRAPSSNDHSVSGPKIIVDYTAPQLSNVKDGSEAGKDVQQSAAPSLGVSWSTSDSESGIAKVEVAFGVKDSLESVQTFTTVAKPTDGKYVVTTDKLAAGITYFSTVRVTNGAGLTTTKTSDGWLYSPELTA